MQKRNRSEKEKIFNLHPTDKLLANFINKNLSLKKQEKVMQHLLYCDECMEIVAIVSEPHSPKSKRPSWKRLQLS